MSDPDAEEPTVTSSAPHDDAQEHARDPGAPREEAVVTDAGSSTDVHVTGAPETGGFTTDETPTAGTPADGSSNAGVNRTGANRPGADPAAGR